MLSKRNLVQDTSGILGILHLIKQLIPMLSKSNISPSLLWPQKFVFPVFRVFLDKCDEFLLSGWLWRITHSRGKHSHQMPNGNSFRGERTGNLMRLQW